MNPYKMIGVGIAVVLAITALLMAAHKLVEVGQENGDLRAENAALRQQLTEAAEGCRDAVAEVQLDVIRCNQRVDEARTAGDVWKTKYEALSRRGPTVVEVPVDIEATTCIGALLEAHLEVGPNLIAMVEEVTGGGP